MKLVREILRCAGLSTFHLFTDSVQPLDAAFSNLGVEDPETLWRAANSDRVAALPFVVETLGTWLRIAGLFEAQPKLQIVSASDVSSLPYTSSWEVRVQAGDNLIVSRASPERRGEFRVHIVELPSSRFERGLAVLETISQRERDVLRRRIGIEGPAETLEEIGVRYGVTRERIRQIETRAVKRLQHPQRRRVVLPAVESLTLTAVALGLSADHPDLPRATATAFGADETAVRAIVRLMWKIGYHVGWLEVPRVYRVSESSLGLIPGCVEAIGLDTMFSNEEFDGLILEALARIGDGVRRDRLLTEVVRNPIVASKLHRCPLFAPRGRLALASIIRPRGDGTYHLKDIKAPHSGVRRTWTLLLRELVVRRELQDGPRPLSFLHARLKARLPTWAQISEGGLANYCQTQSYLSWAGKSTYALEAAGGLTRRAKELHVARGNRRVGIADEIEAFLIERREASYQTIEDHILQRFAVNSASVAAAIDQDQQSRFAWKDSETVRLVD